MTPLFSPSVHQGHSLSVYFLESSACVCGFSCVRPCNSIDCRPPGSSVHGILQQEYWSGLPRPPPGDLPNPGTEPISLMSPALVGRLFTTSVTWEAVGSKPRLLGWGGMCRQSYVTNCSAAPFRGRKVPSVIFPTYTQPHYLFLQ